MIRVKMACGKIMYRFKIFLLLNEVLISPHSMAVVIPGFPKLFDIFFTMITNISVL